MAKNTQAPVSQPEENEKVMVKGVDDGFEAVRKSTKALLDAQPKRSVRLHQLPKGQPQLPDETVCVNGYIYLLKRGEECEVPETVYQILRESSLI